MSAKCEAEQESASVRLAELKSQMADRIKTANGCEQIVTVNYKFIGEI